MSSSSSSKSPSSQSPSSQSTPLQSTPVRVAFGTTQSRFPTTTFRELRSRGALNSPPKSGNPQKKTKGILKNKKGARTNKRVHIGTPQGTVVTESASYPPERSPTGQLKKPSGVGASAVSRRRSGRSPPKTQKKRRVRHVSDESSNSPFSPGASQSSSDRPSFRSRLKFGGRKKRTKRRRRKRRKRKRRKSRKKRKL